MPKAEKSHLFDDERAGAIYRTAARMIYEKGFDATSMNGIAEALGMTKPGLYYYVKGKKELLYSIMSFAMGQLDEYVIGPARAIENAEERLQIIVRQHARLLTQENEAGVLAILMDEVGGLSPEQRDRIVERKRVYFDFVRSTLEELDAADRLRPINSTVGAFSILGMVMWISRWYQPDGLLSSEEVVSSITRFALAGLLRDPQQNPAVAAAKLQSAPA